MKRKGDSLLRCFDYSLLVGCPQAGIGRGSSAICRIQWGKTSPTVGERIINIIAEEKQLLSQLYDNRA
jgi:hypothetical protein